MPEQSVFVYLSHQNVAKQIADVVLWAEFRYRNMTAPFRFTTDQDVANAVIPKLLFWTRLPNRGLSSLLADPFESLSLLWTALADAYANPMNLLLFLQSGLTSFGLNLVIGLGKASVVPTFNKDSAVCVRTPMSTSWLPQTRYCNSLGPMLGTRCLSARVHFCHSTSATWR